MKKYFVGALFVAAIGGCSSAPVREPPTELVDFKPTAEVKEVWSTDIGAKTKDAVALTPAISDKVIYTVDRKGQVRAWAIDSGKRLWETDLNTVVTSGVGVGQGLVLVGTRRGQVIALAQATGKQLWNAPVSSEVLAPPIVSNDVVVAQTGDGKLFGFAVADGKRQWLDERSEPALSLRGTDTPAISGDSVVAGFANGKLVALQLRDGHPLWEAAVSQPRGRNEIERLVDVDAPPLVFADAIYAASYQGKLTAINPHNGAIGWSRDVSTYTGLASDGKNIYLTDDVGRVLAFDRVSGASVWKQEALRGRELNMPAVYHGFIIVADFEGYVHWLAADDGHFVARHRISHEPIRGPAVTDGETLFVADQSGMLAALRSQTN
ncbi:MAG: outer membrane protein assembly factor BamB [Gammaproteobacteria bacterium]|nr:outer membrane protein assembly factor BamB [Gammaproteobacteria bacterium]